jgi:Zn-dependent protease with chaperone function
MSDDLTEGYRLTGISPKAYEHPADRAATAALAAVPYLDTVVRKLIELGYERALRQSYLGGAIRLGEDQLREVHTLHRACYVTLDLEEVPDAYIVQMADPNAFAIGAKKPIVVLGSSTRDLLEHEELRAVFAHEAGHILSDHMLYRTALMILLRLTLAGPVNLPLMPVRAALLEWSRASELTCDRAAALVTRDPMAVCRALMAISAGVPARELNVGAFLLQSQDYTERGTGLERLSRLLADLQVTHALPVRRVKELMDWVRSGEYDRIVGGDYLTRDQTFEPRAEAGEAAAHYAERFRDVFKETGDSLGDAGQRLGDWLKKTQRGPDA